MNKIPLKTLAYEQSQNLKNHCKKVFEECRKEQIKALINSPNPNAFEEIKRKLVIKGEDFTFSLPLVLFIPKNTDSITYLMQFLKIQIITLDCESIHFKEYWIDVKFYDDSQICLYFD